MVVKVLGSSSKGNCYVLDNGREAMILECGVKFLEVKKALNFHLERVVGCLVTHRHGDHSKYVKDVVGCGINTLALVDVWDAVGIGIGRNVLAIKPGQGYRFGGFRVLPFAALHDVPCVGYLIEHADMGRMLFLTDSYTCEYTFPGLNHIFIECNYSDTDLAVAIREGRTMPYQRERLMTSHCELSTCKEILRRNDLTHVSNIVLIHLSDNNSNAQRFVEEIQALTGKCVYVGRPGLTVDMTDIC